MLGERNFILGRNVPAGTPLGHSDREPTLRIFGANLYDFRNRAGVRFNFHVLECGCGTGSSGSAGWVVSCPRVPEAEPQSKGKQPDTRDLAFGSYFPFAQSLVCGTHRAPRNLTNKAGISQIGEQAG